MRRVPLMAASALSVALSVALSACSSEPPGPRIEQPDRVTLDAGDSYVALGDSYTSGPRIGRATGIEGCEQTARNYPHLLAARLDLDLVDVSCGGATTANLLSGRHLGSGEQVPPQLDAVRPDTDLVTLSLGGNDGRVFNDLVSTCVGLATTDRNGSPCADRDEDDPGNITEALAGVTDNLVEGIEEIRRRAPQAIVVVVGYPQVFPESGSCRERLPLARGDVRFAHDVMRRLIEAQREAADRAGAEYVDVMAASAGRDICSDDPWIAGIVPDGRALAYHPYAAEQEAVADLLVELTGD